MSPHVTFSLTKDLLTRLNEAALEGKEARSHVICAALTAYLSGELSVDMPRGISADTLQIPLLEEKIRSRDALIELYQAVLGGAVAKLPAKKKKHWWQRR